MAAERRLTPSHNSTNPATDSAAPKASAPLAESRPEGSGRPEVRRMWRSASRSYHWFRAAVPEAMSPVPTMVCSREKQVDALQEFEPVGGGRESEKIPDPRCS